MKVAGNLKSKLLASFATLYSAGGLYWMSRLFLRHAGEFGEEPHWLERVAGPAHLVSAFTLVFVVGMFWPSHVAPAIRAGRQRLSGWAYLALMSGLAATGVAVVYGSERVVNLAGQVHPWIGASLMPLLAVHWRMRRRAARKARRPRAVRGKVIKLQATQVMTTLGLAAVVFGLTSSAYGAESQFGFVYTTDLLPKGEKEIEQWVTWRHQKVDGTFDLLEGRSAYEYGVADDFQVALYASYAWKQAFHDGPFSKTTPPEQFMYVHPGPDDYYSASRFIGFSFESIYRLLSPYINPVGLALYLEPTLGEQFVEVESKIILQKNFLDDLLTLGFNFTYAPEFREVDSAWQEETDLNFSLGASYRFVENWSAGIEFENERELNSLGFVHTANSAYYLGPSFHYGAKSFFVTGVFFFQLPWSSVYPDTTPGVVVNGYNLDLDNERYRLRVKLGFYF